MKDVREEYHAEGLSEANLHTDPVEQARRWVDEAIEGGLPLPNAMTLATVSADGQPSSRVVLLKGIEGGGFTFFTHYDSRKGEEIAANPKVSFTMFWQPFDRQLIVIGEARKVDEEESDSYFASRPYASQISAASLVGSEMCIRDSIMPTEIQFWHGRPSRLHDRFRYRKQADGRWVRERLAP